MLCKYKYVGSKLHTYYLWVWAYAINSIKNIRRKQQYSTYNIIIYLINLFKFTGYFVFWGKGMGFG